MVILIVYPACAGIDRVYLFRFELVNRLPRMRGDRPLRVSAADVVAQFTPHARGSTQL